MTLRYGKILVVILTFAALTTGALWAASVLEQNIYWQEHIESFGIIGVVLVGFLCGLNAFVPIPPATFAPLFIASGLSPLLVIAGFVVGTTMADSIGYVLGWFGSTYVNDHHPKITAYFEKLFAAHLQSIPVMIFVYFAFVPLPNEIVMIPLGLIGYKYKDILLPLIAGNIIHHSIMVFGYSKIFSWFF